MVKTAHSYLLTHKLVCSMPWELQLKMVF